MTIVKSLNDFRLDESKIYESEEDGMLVGGEVQEFGVRWYEFDSKDRSVMKEKFFDSEKKMKAFTDKLQQKDNFMNFYSYTGPEAK